MTFTLAAAFPERGMLTVSRRRVFSGLAVAAAIVVAAALIVKFALLGSSPAQASFTTLSIISGTVEVRDEGTDEFRPAEDGETLEVGDSVRTRPDSRALITFFEGSTLEMEPETEVTLESLEGEEEGGFFTKIGQSIGVTWHRVVEFTDGGSSYEVETPATVVAVRGTLFQVEVEADGTTTPDAIRGELAVRAQGIEKLVGPGMRTRVRPRQPPQEPFALPPPPSTLELKLSSAALLLVETPFSTAAGLVPPGYPVSQEPGATITMPPEEPQVVLLRRVVDGTYSAFLYGIASGRYELEVTGRNKDDVACQGRSEGAIEEGERWVVSIDVEEEGGSIIECAISDPELATQAPKAVLVKRDLLLARLPPLPTPVAATPSPAPTSTVVSDTGSLFLVDAYLSLTGSTTIPPQMRESCLILSSASNVRMDAVRVETPLGTSVILPPYTGVLGPGDDPVTPFSFSDCVPVSPVAGGTYRFVALDAADEPLPGVEATDVWVGVEPPDPPSNVSATVTAAGLEVTWDEVPEIPASFEPNAVPQLGFYQLVLGPVEEPGPQSAYGAAHVAVSSHTIPWRSADFIEGVDHGLALGELPPGSYRLGVWVHSMAPEGTAGNGFEYNNTDPAESVDLQVTAEGEVSVLS
jgi:hypothetical protein